MTTASDIETFLADLGLSQYLQLFQDNAITPSNLETLTDEELQGMGISVLGHRKTLLKAFQSEVAAPAPIQTPPESIAPADPGEEERLAKATKLLQLSELLGGAGILCMVIVGPGIGIWLENWIFGGFFFLLGGVGAVVAAIVGQVGRAMQGRII